MDNQQLFLGNIPHHASEEELKALFARFGNVLDLRILPKSAGKLPPGVRNPLNYGFITYADAESVQNCLAHCVSSFANNKLFIYESCFNLTFYYISINSY